MVDRYTKAVLTIIAVCLVVLVFKGSPSNPALASEGPVHVIIDQAQPFAFQFAGPIEVRQQ